MNSDWEEVKRLAADFQRAQLTSTALKLSERNCIEIVKKLIESKLVEVIFTSDGKEYLTAARLIKEMKDELIVHGGRINVVELAQIIGVDLSHVETHIHEIVESELNVTHILGQLITKEYLDHLAEEVNEKLQQSGQVTIIELVKLYDLPGDFLEQNIRSRLGSIIQGQADPTDPRIFFTDIFVSQNTAKIRGAFSAVVRPVPLSSIISNFNFPEKICFRVVDEMIKEGKLAGSLSGGRSEYAIYIPEIYARSQNEWIESFFKQNGYIDYDSMTRLGIQDPKSFAKKKFPDSTQLKSCCISAGTFAQVEASIDEALRSGGWTDLLPVLPSVLSPEDYQSLIATINHLPNFLTYGVLHVYCDTIIVNDRLLKTFQRTLEESMDQKAKEDLAKNPELLLMPKAAKKETVISGKASRKEERKKKTSLGGKTGGGTQGRETKTKHVKKKYFTNKDSENFDEEALSPEAGALDLQFLTESEIANRLIEGQLKGCPEELASEVAAELHGPLTMKYNKVVQALHEAMAANSGAARRLQHSECQERLCGMLGHIVLFEKAAKLFPDEVSNQLLKHLLKSLCSELANIVVNYLSQESTKGAAEIDAQLTPEVRKKLINELSDELRQPLLKLHNSLNEKTLDDFHSSLDDVFGVCDMIVKKPDKKKEKLLLSNQRQSLLVQLREAQDAALVLHLASLLLFQVAMNMALHATGKFVPHVIVFLRGKLNAEQHSLLSTCQELVMKMLTAAEGSEEREEAETLLKEIIPKIKELAETRKISTSE